MGGFRNRASNGAALTLGLTLALVAVASHAEHVEGPHHSKEKGGVQYLKRETSVLGTDHVHTMKLVDHLIPPSLSLNSLAPALDPKMTPDLPGYSEKSVEAAGPAATADVSKGDAKRGVMKGEATGELSLKSDQNAANKAEGGANAVNKDQQQDQKLEKVELSSGLALSDQEHKLSQRRKEDDSPPHHAHHHKRQHHHSHHHHRLEKDEHHHKKHHRHHKASSDEEEDPDMADTEEEFEEMEEEDPTAPAADSPVSHHRKEKVEKKKMEDEVEAEFEDVEADDAESPVNADEEEGAPKRHHRNKHGRHHRREKDNYDDIPAEALEDDEDTALPSTYYENEEKPKHHHRQHNKNHGHGHHHKRRRHHHHHREVVEPSLATDKLKQAVASVASGPGGGYAQQKPTIIRPMSPVTPQQEEPVHHLRREMPSTNEGGADAVEQALGDEESPQEQHGDGDRAADADEMADNATEEMEGKAAPAEGEFYQPQQSAVGGGQAGGVVDGDASTLPPQNIGDMLGDQAGAADAPDSAMEEPEMKEQPVDMSQELRDRAPANFAVPDSPLPKAIGVETSIAAAAKVAKGDGPGTPHGNSLNGMAPPTASLKREHPPMLSAQQEHAKEAAEAAKAQNPQAAANDAVNNHQITDVAYAQVEALDNAQKMQKSEVFTPADPLKQQQQLMRGPSPRNPSRNMNPGDHDPSLP